MKKLPIYVLIGLIISLIPILSVVQAATTTYSANITTSLPTFTCPDDPGPWYYQAFTYSPTTSGDHTIEVQNSSTSVAGVLVYESGDFDPNCYITNLLGVAFPSITLPMSSGVDYTLISSVQYPDLTGTFDVVVTAPDPDADSDGVPDDQDNCPSDPNPGQEDTDNDGIGDACDSVNDDDTDGDGVNNDVDNCPSDANPGQEDTDNDGIGDVCDPVNDDDTDGDGVNNDVDNCPNVANPGQEDIDNDNIGDACDSVNDDDTDGDGINNDVDNCPNVANPGQEDTDNDNIGDACDSVNDDDVDGDGVNNDVDNCPNVANPGQEDTDNDGTGDACDNGGSPNNPVTNTNVPDPDPDGDGISGDRDNCPYDYNPDQEDGWGSSAGDLCDTDWYNNTGRGVSGFGQKDGTYHVHGNCTYMDDGDPRCPIIASFDPSQLSSDNAPLDVTSDAAGTWSVVIHYLHSNHGYAVYQVNIYSTNPPQPDTLVDDRLEIHVRGSSWQWRMRGGASNFNGI